MPAYCLEIWGLIVYCKETVSCVLYKHIKIQHILHFKFLGSKGDGLKVKGDNLWLKTIILICSQLRVGQRFKNDSAGQFITSPRGIILGWRIHSHYASPCTCLAPSCSLVYLSSHCVSFFKDSLDVVWAPLLMGVSISLLTWWLDSKGAGQEYPLSSCYFQ